MLASAAASAGQLSALGFAAVGDEDRGGGDAWPPPPPRVGVLPACDVGDSVASARLRAGATESACTSGDRGGLPGGQGGLPGTLSGDPAFAWGGWGGSGGGTAFAMALSLSMERVLLDWRLRRPVCLIAAAALAVVAAAMLPPRRPSRPLAGGDGGGGGNGTPGGSRGIGNSRRGSRGNSQVGSRSGSQVGSNAGSPAPLSRRRHSSLGKHHPPTSAPPPGPEVAPAPCWLDAPACVTAPRLSRLLVLYSALLGALVAAAAIGDGSVSHAPGLLLFLGGCRDPRASDPASRCCSAASPLPPLRMPPSPRSKRACPFWGAGYGRRGSAPACLANGALAVPEGGTPSSRLTSPSHRLPLLRTILRPPFSLPQAGWPLASRASCFGGTPCPPRPPPLEPPPAPPPPAFGGASLRCCRSCSAPSWRPSPPSAPCSACAAALSTCCSRRRRRTALPRWPTRATTVSPPGGKGGGWRGGGALVFRFASVANTRHWEGGGGGGAFVFRFVTTP